MKTPLHKAVSNNDAVYKKEPENKLVYVKEIKVSGGDKIMK